MQLPHLSKSDRRNLSLALLGLLPAFCAIAAAQSQPSQDSQQSSPQLLVRISEKHGQPVSVAPSDLALLLDGQSVLVRELKPAQDVPLRFLVLVDLSNSNRDKLGFERKAAAQLFEALSKNPNNAGYLGWFTLETRISTHPVSAGDAAQWLSRAAVGGPTALYDAIATACSHAPLQRNPGTEQERRVLFLLTDGEDNQSRISASEAAKAAQAQGVPIFALGMLSSSPNRTGGSVLNKLAKETGGEAVLLEAPGRFLDRLMQPLETQYFLAFDLPPSPPGATRKLELKPSNRKLEVMAPKALVGP